LKIRCGTERRLKRWEIPNSHETTRRAPDKERIFLTTKVSEKNLKTKLGEAQDWVAQRKESRIERAIERDRSCLWERGCVIKINDA